MYKHKVWLNPKLKDIVHGQCIRIGFLYKVYV
jgi:hypothetical protein